jgi:hypothetical protein
MDRTLISDYNTVRNVIGNPYLLDFLIAKEQQVKRRELE